MTITLTILGGPNTLFHILTFFSYPLPLFFIFLFILLVLVTEWCSLSYCACAYYLAHAQSRFFSRSGHCGSARAPGLAHARRPLPDAERPCTAPYVELVTWDSIGIPDAAPLLIRWCIQVLHIGSWSLFSHWLWGIYILDVWGRTDTPEEAYEKRASGLWSSCRRSLQPHHLCLQYQVMHLLYFRYLHSLYTHVLATLICIHFLI